MDSIYTDLTLLWAVIVFVVDLSGWTDTLLRLASRFTARYGLPPVHSLRPLTCSLCTTWWTGIAFALIRGQFSLTVLAFIAALSFLSITLRELFIFIRETLTTGIAKLNKWLND